jgi:cell division septation protein DedD
MSDEGFHEIQLNGKQLVFLFMAATVVSVVIFLCGVMVGRGVRAERGGVEVAEAAPAAGPQAELPATSAPARPANATDAAVRDDAAPSPPANQEPPATPEDDVYQQLMAGGDSKADTLKPRAEEPPQASKSAETLAPPSKADAAKNAKAEKAAKDAVDKAARDAKAAADAKKNPPARADMGPTDPGTFAVQIAALRERAEADEIAKRLAGKGYAAYVLVPPVGGTPVYKVQVGRFKNRQDAEKTAARLKKEERFSPWVTR